MDCFDFYEISTRTLNMIIMSVIIVTLSCTDCTYFQSDKNYYDDLYVIVKVYVAIAQLLEAVWYIVYL